MAFLFSSCAPAAATRTVLLGVLRMVVGVLCLIFNIPGLFILDASVLPKIWRGTWFRALSTLLRGSYFRA